MDYYNMNGAIAEYRGHYVYVIDWEKLSPAQAIASSKDTIFAVRKKGSTNMALVQGTEKIGTLQRDGRVIREESDFFKFYTPPEENDFSVSSCKEETEKPEEKIELVLKTDINYKDYSKEVDRFFKGLHELWKEMPV